VVIVLSIKQLDNQVRTKKAIRKDAGLAMRFPKFTGKIRVEKFAEDASTNEEVITLYRGQKKVAHDKTLM